MDTSSNTAGIFAYIQPTFSVTEIVVYVVIILLLLWISGFLSAVEVALFSLSPKELNQLSEQAPDSGRKLMQMRKQPERLMASIDITDTFINVAIIALGHFLLLQLLGEHYFNIWFILGAIIVMTLFILIFGEIIPKYYATRHVQKLSLQSIPFLLFLNKLLYPLASLSTGLERSARKLNKDKGYNLSVDELEQALEMTDKNEISEEKNMLEGIIRFGGETAKEIMTPRLDIVDLDIHSPYEEVLKCITDNVYSRIPVYADNIDNIKGILYIKDLLPHLGKPHSFRWQSLIRPPYFVPETKKIDDLLREFQTNKVHIAIVVDEFGGTSGIVTMEDIIEEIVGEINDEYDEDEKTYIKLSPNTYIFEGKTLLSDFYKVLDIDEDIFDKVAGDADTLAGLLLELKGEFPTIHEQLKFHNFLFEVLEMDARRIMKVKLTVLKETSQKKAGND